MVSGGVVGPPPRQPSDGSDGWWGGGSRARSRFRTAAQQRARVRPPRTDEQLRNSFNFKLYAIKLASACRMYGVVMPAEGLGYRAHNALWDAEAAGRLYFAMRGIVDGRHVAAKVRVPV